MMESSDSNNWRESLRFYILALLTMATMSVIFVVTLESIQFKLPPFCPINGNGQFKKMVEESLLNANASGNFCTNSTNISVHYRKFEVGRCRYDCNHHDWLKIGVKCPISLVGLKYTSNNDHTRWRCYKGNFTMTFFAQLGNTIDVASIRVHDYGSHTKNNERVNWLTYLARNGAVTTVKETRKVGGNFQFVDDNEILNEKPEKWCNRNPTCQDL